MHLSRGDANLGAHAKLAAIGELRRCVAQQDGTVEPGEEETEEESALI